MRTLIPDMLQNLRDNHWKSLGFPEEIIPTIDAYLRRGAKPLPGVRCIRITRWGMGRCV